MTATVAVLLSLGGCAGAASAPQASGKPAYGLGLAFRPGPCVAGANVVPASFVVVGAGAPVRYLQPTDGELRVALVTDGAPTRPIQVRWLGVNDPPSSAMPPPPPNVELVFASTQAGDCSLRVELRPSPLAAQAGLGPALTTIVLKASPPPPPAGSP